MERPARGVVWLSIGLLAVGLMAVGAAWAQDTGGADLNDDLNEELQEELQDSGEGEEAEGPAEEPAEVEVTRLLVKRAELLVRGVRERGDYLEIDLELAPHVLQAYVDLSDTCEALFAEGGEVTYVNEQSLGVLHRGDVSCALRGIGNLEFWRDRGPGATNPSRRTRSQAKFEVVHRDREFVFLRGRFLLANYLRFDGNKELIAVVPARGGCDYPIAQGGASSVYRSKGPGALSLLGTSGLCAVHGLIEPAPVLVK